MKLALKIDVSTRRGAKEGVPRIVELLTRHQARATFFLALGPAHLFGCRWLPAVEIGRRSAAVLRGLQSAGFEVALQAHDPARWTQEIGRADAAWTQRAMERACSDFLRLFDRPPHAHAATDWQMNRHAWRLMQRLGFHYGSNARGRCPFIPIRNAEIIACPELPTTLPMLDEVMAQNGQAPDESVSRLLELTAHETASPHVYTARAEREGGAFAAQFASLLEGWRAQGYVLCALEDVLENLNLARLPRHGVVEGTVPGRLRPLSLQGEEFLAGQT